MRDNEYEMQVLKKAVGLCVCLWTLEFSSEAERSQIIFWGKIIITYLKGTLKIK